MSQIYLYDTTLRDGSQREGISFSVEDKLRIAQRLDELGIHYIEGGWPGANPKDAEFFQRAKHELKLQHAVLAAFGSTRRANGSADTDATLLGLLEAETKVITLVGKSWDLHVHRVIETSLEENLNMIADSIAFLKAQGRTVFFDAEHFFDGYRANPDYALRCIKVAEEAGAEAVVLCDTNGGSLPEQVFNIVSAVRQRCRVALGIHTHNDTETAVASALAALHAGATQVQGTINGYGERTGNANLCSLIPNLKLKMGIDCITDAQLAQLTEVSRFVSELANLPPEGYQAYVGLNAFTHKAGLHASAVAKLQESYQHTMPEKVGNRNAILVSELAGRSNVLYKARELGIALTEEQVRKVLTFIKEQENTGFQYEVADASVELILRRAQPGYRPPFQLLDFMVIVEKGRRPSYEDNGEDLASEATIKVRIQEGAPIHTAAVGNGPVNALDKALRTALLQFFHQLERVRLTDYKVRVVESPRGTASTVRVLIESSDGQHQWRTVGSSTNIIEASWQALADSYEYWLVRQGLG